MAKKKNAHIWLRESDLRRIERECTHNATNYAIILLLSVLHDKWGFGSKRLAKVLSQTDELADSISNGYVKLEDLRSMIEDECGIRVIKGEKENAGN